MRRLLVGLLAATAIVLSTQGCDSNVTDHHNTDAGCAAATYDLSQPATRADLGLEAGKSFMDKSCDAGFELKLTLPQDASTSLTARRVNADSYGADTPATGAPTTMDVHSVALSVDDAVQVGGRIAGDLGTTATALQTWRQQVAAGSGDSVDSPFLRNTLGYLTVEMQVQHLGSGGNYLHLVLTWN